MPNIAEVLRDEIRRLARKEIKAATAGLRQDNIKLKKSVADHKRRVAALEREVRGLVKAEAKREKEMPPATSGEVESARITAKMIRGLREKLGLSRDNLARLLEVSPQSVYQWEQKTGRLTFRGDAKARIVEVRKLGVREARECLEKIKAKS